MTTLEFHILMIAGGSRVPVDFDEDVLESTLDDAKRSLLEKGLIKFVGPKPRLMKLTAAGIDALRLKCDGNAAHIRNLAHDEELSSM